MKKALLTIEKLNIAYPSTRRSFNPAVCDVSFSIMKGEMFGLVGESGCGKSSLAKAVMRFIEPASGNIFLEDINLAALDKKDLRAIRHRFQMVFQDTSSSLNPNRTIGASLLQPLKLSAALASPEQRVRRLHNILAQVGLDPAVLNHLPRRLSGGQCQRVQIARALATEPELLICDEPVSSLDASLQAQIMNLIRELQVSKMLTVFFISHDLAIVKNNCDRIAVMYGGRICEISLCLPLFDSPLHPYTRMLLDAIPTIGEKWRSYNFKVVSEQLTPPGESRFGCVFSSSCSKADSRCRKEGPEMCKVSEGRYVACHHPLLL